MHQLKYIILLGFIWLHLQSLTQNQFAIDLDGNESCFVNTDNDNNLNLNSSYTIEAWIYVREFQAFDRILDRRTVFALDIIAPKGLGDYGINFNERDDDDDVLLEIETNISDEDLFFNTWYHIAVTFDGSDCKLYVNNILVGLYSSSYWSLSDGGIYGLNIGGRFWNGSYGYQINAIIDEVRISNIARDITEMQTSSHFEEYTIDDNTILLMHFNDQHEDPSYESAVDLTGTTGGDDFDADDYSDDSIDDPDFLLRPKYKSKQSGDWNSESNWEVEFDTNNFVNSNSIPTKFSESIEIQNSHIIEISSTDTASAYDLSIDTGGGLEIGGDFRVDHNLTNNAGEASLLLKSTKTNQGSLIHHNSGVEATVERYIEGYTEDYNGWHLLSAPVDHMAIATSNFLPTPSEDDLYYWDENDSTLGMWINYYGSGFTHFTNGKGYLCAYKNSATKSFTGELNVADIPWSNFSADIDRWHMLGNPFACALDWREGDWNKTDVSMAEIYDESRGNYYPLDDPTMATPYIIPSTQGFFVQVADASNTITIPAAARVHNAQDWYKKSENQDWKDLIVYLKTDQSIYEDHTTLRFDANASMNYEVERDSRKIFGSPSAPQISTIYEEDKFCLNYVPDFFSEELIPLNIYCPAEGNYEITINSSNPQLNYLLLEDKQSNEMHNLISLPNYHFYAAQGENPNRFVLHLSAPDQLEETKQFTLHIFTSGKQMIIQSTNELKGEIELYSLDGKLIFEKRIFGGNLYSEFFGELKGMYIARFTSSTEKHTSKLFF